jgi:hypothetical protein
MCHIQHNYNLFHVQINYMLLQSKMYIRYIYLLLKLIPTIELIAIMLTYNIPNNMRIELKLLHIFTNTILKVQIQNILIQ